MITTRIRSRRRSPCTPLPELRPAGRCKSASALATVCSRPSRTQDPRIISSRFPPLIVSTGRSPFGPTSSSPWRTASAFHAPVLFATRPSASTLRASWRISSCCLWAAMTLSSAPNGWRRLAPSFGISAT
uniref:Uncharacterized protein n=1 Tax=Arundo donax TaxID=35708 RepID=A0A0A8Z6E4_ARUDO